MLSVIVCGIIGGIIGGALGTWLIHLIFDEK